MTSTQPVTARARKARRTSRCPGCGGWIQVGARIVRLDHRGWICVHCAIAWWRDLQAEPPKPGRGGEDHDR